ncbi:hypothetical protein NIE88_05950 [Sporolactobacillus shoreicorticis]|uniref:Uncharacterized protein n=1 Tax=Sporolactobacillus shoreicorticis TaxID=1923877 RepID=A0ABW5S274_9BACL|nr:hypothetical protein [Sporolactobacillus shoreicorticis]MCO7125307.1 hypothetical protein [Sporolactobacillus shoreicorticis]
MFNEEDMESNNFTKFGFATPEALANSGQPLTLPVAPIIPSFEEKKALYAYYE